MLEAEGGMGEDEEGGEEPAVVLMGEPSSKAAPKPRDSLLAE